MFYILFIHSYVLPPTRLHTSGASQVKPVSNDVSPVLAEDQPGAEHLQISARPPLCRFEHVSRRRIDLDGHNYKDGVNVVNYIHPNINFFIEVEL